MTVTRSIRICAIALGVVLALSTHAHAIAIAEATVWQDGDAPVQDAHTDSEESSANVSLPLGSAWAEVSIPRGTLRTYAHTTSSDVGGNHGAQAQAFASSEDWYTLVGLDPGTSVWLTAVLDVHGFLAVNPATSLLAYAVYTVYFAGPAGETLTSLPGGETSINESFSQLFYVTPGEPFRVVAELYSAAVGFRTTNALSDFWGTARLRFDLPDGAAISSAEGFFQSSSSRVPEPGVLLLLTSGLVTIAALTRKRRP